MSRYELRPVGVFDRVLGRDITPADADAWLAYQQSLAASPPDPAPPALPAVPPFNFRAAGAARQARAIERLAAQDPTKALLAQGGYLDVEPDTV